MSFVAPNLLAIVGSTIAAKMMGAAGGLTGLSKMPACNILVVGAQRRTLAGFSTAAILPHAGFIFYSEIVQTTPEDLRRKASRLTAAKCALAARVDSFHQCPSGEIGQSKEGVVSHERKDGCPHVICCVCLMQPFCVALSLWVG